MTNPHLRTCWTLLSCTGIGALGFVIGWGTA